MSMRSPVLVVVVAALVSGACSGSDGTSAPVEAGIRRGDEGAVPAAHACDAPAGSTTDVAGEPDARSYAEYETWTDRDGCTVRIDVLAERPGAEHCGFERARVIVVGSPIGEVYTSPADAVEYVRDPDRVFGEPALAEGFEADATVPADAVDVGFRRDATELWAVPEDPTAIYLRTGDVSERWPRGDSPACE